VRAQGREGERFPGFDVVDRRNSWDAVTAGVVLARLAPPPAPRFFTPEEERVARPLFRRLLALDEGPPVPVFELVDARLADGETDGWRHEDLPPDGDAWRTTLRLLDEDAAAGGFVSLAADAQDELLESIRVADSWHGLAAARIWNLWMRYACAAFYSHPGAWNDIGFGGPAYPVGYKNLGVGGREPWEVRERDARDPEPWAHRVERARRRR
jgi:hypothetical protein